MTQGLLWGGWWKARIKNLTFSPIIYIKSWFIWKKCLPRLPIKWHLVIMIIDAHIDHPEAQKTPEGLLWLANELTFVWFTQIGLLIPTILRAFSKSWAIVPSLGEVDFLQHFHELAKFIIIILFGSSFWECYFPIRLGCPKYYKHA